MSAEESSAEENAKDVIVLGAGPVGLAAALLLAQQGRRVTIYEAEHELDLSSANSYPIGVNTRGQEALRRIDPTLLEELRTHGELVEAFHIYNGTHRVSRLESGKLVATTRAFLTELLLDRVEQSDRITCLLDHRVVDVDLAHREITFERASGESVTVDASRARVLASTVCTPRPATGLPNRCPASPHVWATGACTSGSSSPSPSCRPEARPTSAPHLHVAGDLHGDPA